MNARTPSPSGRGNELDFAIFNRILRRKISKRRAPSLEQGEEALLNYALELAIYCSGYWLNQIHERLRQAYPEMRPEGLDRLNRIALAAVKSGQDLVHWMAEQREQGKELQQSVWAETYLKQYPWVDQENLGHLFLSGMYYAWKDGLG